MKDYKVTVKDSSGKTCDLFITADSVNELVESGYSVEDAKQSLEDNQFANEIARGNIGADAYLVTL